MHSVLKMLASFITVLILVTGCTTINPYTGEQQTSRTTTGAGVGAVGGALLGGALGGGRGAIFGALAGGVAGAAVGNSMDRQDAMLRQRLRGTGVQVMRTSDGIQLVLASDVTFSKSSSDIKSSFFKTLESVAIVLHKFNDTNIIISGYTSNTGTAAFNQQLSERRARSVGDYLASQGINRKRIFTQGFGQRYPIASNDTVKGRRLNRRVVITLRQMAK